MKYAITGHTDGIGKTIYNRLLPNIIGFSRSNGYDITKAEDRKRIIEEVKDCDVFINNADDGEKGQFRLFTELHSVWKNQNKKIINVGSQISEVELQPDHPLKKYQLNKIRLKSVTQAVTGSCIVEYKWFGYVSTQKMLDKYPTANFITEDQAADIILT